MTFVSTIKNIFRKTEYMDWNEYKEQADTIALFLEHQALRREYIRSRLREKYNVALDIK